MQQTYHKEYSNWHKFKRVGIEPYRILVESLDGRVASSGVQPFRTPGFPMCSDNSCLCYSFRRLSDAFPMFGPCGTLKSCSFEVPIGPDGILSDAFPMSYCLTGILRQEGVGKQKHWEGKERGRDLKGIGKAS